MKFRRGPATVTASEPTLRRNGGMSLEETPGRRGGAVTWSQENCLTDDHRLTCERWGWGFCGASCLFVFGHFGRRLFCR